MIVHTPDTAEAAHAPVLRPRRAYGVRKCPECGKPFSAHHPKQIFCTAAHKLKFNNRMGARGKTLTPLAMAARIPRGGTNAAKLARAEYTSLLDTYAREDREAGRTSAVDYVNLKWSLFGVGKNG